MLTSNPDFDKSRFTKKYPNQEISDKKDRFDARSRAMHILFENRIYLNDQFGPGYVTIFRILAEDGDKTV